MAYNNGFPMGYQYYQNVAPHVPQAQMQWGANQNMQPYPAMQMQNAPQMNQPAKLNNMIIDWVQGVAGARSYNIQPGINAVLMDSEHDRFYIKTVDASGIPLPLRAFSYVEEELEPAQESAQSQDIDLSGFVTKNELSDLISSEIQKAFASIGEQSAPAKASSKGSTKKVK